MIKIKYSCSLGPCCHSSRLLKTNNLKLESYPFDWIFSNIDSVFECIDKNFENFFTSDFNFFHHSPLSTVHDIDNTDNTDNQYFCRCISRFKKMISCDGVKLFVYSCINQKIYENKINHAKEIKNKLDKYVDNYILLYIYNCCEQTIPSHKLTIHDNIHYLELYTVSVSNGDHFRRKCDRNYINNLIKTMYSIC